MCCSIGMRTRAEASLSSNGGRMSLLGLGEVQNLGKR